MQGVAQLIAESESWLKAALILMSVLVVPLYEEIVFRGVIFPFLLRKWGFAPSVIMVSAAFGLIHFHIPSLFPLFLLSVALCIAYYRTGSLWISIGFHALFNGISIVVLTLLY